MSSVGSSGGTQGASGPLSIVLTIIPSIQFDVTPDGKPLDKVLTYSPSIDPPTYIPPASSTAPQISMSDYYNSVSNPQLKSTFENILEQMNQANLMNGIYINAAQQMKTLRNLISEIYAYKKTQNQLLNNTNFTGLIANGNSAISSYNLTAGNDASQIAAMNSAIDTYNSAQSTYNSAVQTYDTATNTYNGDLSTYNQAVAAFQTALQTYQSSPQGPADQQALANAQATFDAAKSTFSGQQATFATAQATYNAAQSTYNGALAALQSAANTYNAYVATRNTQLSSLISQFNQYNAGAAAANAQIQSLNQTRAILQPPLPPIPLMPIIPTVNTLPTFTVPSPGSDPSIVQANTDINNFNNTTLATYNGSLATINPLIAAYTPSEPQLAALSPIPTIPSTVPGTGSDIPDIVNSNPASLATLSYTPPQSLDIVSLYLVSQLVQITNVKKILKAQKNAVSAYQQGVIEGRIKGHPAGSAAPAGAGSGVALATVRSDYDGNPNPFIVGIVGRQITGTIYDTKGVPAKSPLVDQVNQFGAHIASLSGLTGAAPGAAILGNSSVNNSNGLTAINTAINLGFLKTISGMVNGNTIATTIKGLIAQDPELSTLSPAQVQDVTNLLSADLGTSLLGVAITQVAQQLQLPGLVPQILGNVAAQGQGQGGSSQAFSGSLFLVSSALAQNLEKDANISQAQANKIVLAVQAELNQALTHTTALTAAEQQSAVVNAVATQLENSNSIQANAQLTAQRAYDAAFSQIQSQLTAQENGRASLLSEALTTALIKGKIASDEQEAATYANQVNTAQVLNNLTPTENQQNALASLTSQLQQAGLTNAEAQAAAKAALTTFSTLDPTQNPLRSSTVGSVLSPTQLAEYFKQEVMYRLSPTIGPNNANDVAVSYSALLFTDPHSVLNMKAEKETALSKASNQTYTDRVLADFRDYLAQYNDPSKTLAKLTDPGKIVLTGGSVGGLEVQGMSFMSNNTGKTGHYKHAIQIEA